MTTERQTAANRRNAVRGGVKTDEGKAVSRLNARKHGIFATALTDLDRRELGQVHQRFVADLEPRGTVEEALVAKLALCWLRMERCARAEAQYHRWAWEPEPDLYLRDRRRSHFKPQHFEKIVHLVNRYDVSLTNQFTSLLHELERLRRRRGDGDGAAAGATASP